MQQYNWAKEEATGSISRSRGSLTLLPSLRKSEIQAIQGEQAGSKKILLLRIVTCLSMFSSLCIVQLARESLGFLWSGVLLTIFNLGREITRRRIAEQKLQEQLVVVREMRQQLERVMQLEDRFVALAAHELRTPMTTISGHTQLLLRRLEKMPLLAPELELMRASLERINGQTHRLSALVDDLLDLNKVRLGQADLCLGVCNLGKLCREAVESHRLLSGREIDLVVPALLVLLQGDYERLNQVLHNLLANALKYSPAESAVRVVLTRTAAAAMIRVYDSGSGIAPEFALHIFEPFFRAPEVQETTKGGLGLGLTICKEIVERHRGRMWCESEPGRGSVFCVELPLSCHQVV